MAEQTRFIHVGDTRTVLAVTLSQKNAAGVATDTDLTGLSVFFKMVDSAGVEVIEETETGVTVTDAAEGEVQYDFATDGLLIKPGTDADNDIKVTDGTQTVKNSDGDLTTATLAADITKKLDAAWTAGDDLGGLDTGTAAAGTRYYVWLIYRSDTALEDVLLSLSESAPTMPENYDYKRLLGSVKTGADGSIVEHSQPGISTPGKYYGYFVVVDSEESDHFPVVSRELVIDIQGDV